MAGRPKTSRARVKARAAGLVGGRPETSLRPALTWATGDTLKAARADTEP